MAKKKLEQQQPECVKDVFKPIGEITEEAYIRFGGYANNFRAIPRVQDGLKVSYKRLLHSALTFPKGQNIPTVTLISKVADTHPHGTTGIEGTVRMFVKSGIFSGDGNFGCIYIDGTEADPASPRYTKTRLSDAYIDILGDLVKEVPWIDSPNGPQEPAYMPVPFPLCLSMSERVQGLGVAIKADMPNFSQKSLYAAYINNDPSLLEPGVDLILDKSKSQLQALWTTGKGSVFYAYHLDRVKSDDGKTEGVLIHGDTGIFTLAMKKFQKWLDEGKITVDNVSDMTGQKLLVSRIPGARGITIDNIWDLCTKVCYNSTTYTLNVSDGISSFRIPLYQWLDSTYKNYLNLVISVNQKKIDQVKREIDIQVAIPEVVNYIMTSNPKAENEEISEALQLPIDLVVSVMSKPISYLRKNKDTTARVKDLKNRLSELKKFNPSQFIYNIIQEL